ncbi:MAG: BTAD domain-containing putative transcriptional regulator [Candidatus Promineifilaceae bacterium]
MKEVGSLPEAEGFEALEIRAFGRLRLRHNDRAVSSFSTRKAEELLAYLLLKQGVLHHRDHLIEILWPGVSPEAGRGRLSTTLWRVRSILDELGLIPNHYLETSSDSVGFSLHPQSFFDVVLFQQQIDAGKKAISPADKEAHFLAAEALCAGPLLDEIYSDWCLIERERLSRQRLFGLGQLVHCLMERGAFGEAIERCQKILELDPLREEAHRALMRCYYKMGLRSDGIRQFQICANFLLDELGIYPMPETIELYRSLVREAAKDAGSSYDEPRQKRIAALFADFVTLGDELIDLIEKP